MCSGCGKVLVCAKCGKSIIGMTHVLKGGKTLCVDCGERCSDCIVGLDCNEGELIYNSMIDLGNRPIPDSVRLPGNDWDTFKLNFCPICGKRI